MSDTLFWASVSALEGQVVPTITGTLFEIERVTATEVVARVGAVRRRRHLDRVVLEQADALPRHHGRLSPRDVRSAGIAEYDPAYVAAIVK
jgi:hypothetical protein